MSKTILAVDDSQIMRMLLSGALSRAGYTVLEAKNGAEALNVLRTSPNKKTPDVDMIITDYFMPEMNGLELTKAVRNSGTDLAGIPIIMTSGFRQRELPGEISMHDEVDAWLEKPINVQNLVHVVTEELGTNKKEKTVPGLYTTSASSVQ